MKNATHGLFLLICRPPQPASESGLSCRAVSLSVAYDFLPSSYPKGSLFAFLETYNDGNTTLMSAPSPSGFNFVVLNVDPQTNDVNMTNILDANRDYSLAPLRVSVLETLDDAATSILVEEISAPTRRLRIMSSSGSNITVDTPFQWDSCLSSRIAVIHKQIRFLQCEYSGEQFLVAINITGSFSVRMTSVLGPVVSAWPTSSGLLFLRVGPFLTNPGGDLLILDVGSSDNVAALVAKSIDLSSIFDSAQVSLGDDAVVGVVEVQPFRHAVFFDTGVVLHISYDTVQYPEGFTSAVIMNFGDCSLSEPASHNGSTWIAVTQSVNTTLYSIALGNSSALTVASPVLSRPSSFWNPPGKLLVINGGSRLVWLASTSLLTLVDQGVVSNDEMALIPGFTTPYKFCAEVQLTGELILISDYAAVAVNMSTKVVRSIASSPPLAFTSCGVLKGTRGAIMLWKGDSLFIADGSSGPLAVAGEFTATGVVGPIKPPRQGSAESWLISVDPPQPFRVGSANQLLIGLQSERNASMFTEKRIIAVPLPCRSDSYCTNTTFCNLQSGMCQASSSDPAPASISPAIAPTAPLGCLANPPSPSGFVCQNGEWVSPQSVVVSANPNGTFLYNLTISGTVRIRGNFSIDESIGDGDISVVIKSGSVLIVEGCVALRGIVLVDLTAAVLVSRNGSFAILEFESYCSASANLTKKRAPPTLFAEVETVQNSVTLKPCETIDASLQYNEKSIVVLFTLPEPRSTCEPVSPVLQFDIAAVVGIIWGALGVFIVSSCIMYYFWTRAKSGHAEDDAELDLELQEAEDVADTLPMTPRAGDDHYIDLNNVEGALRNRLASMNLIPASDVKLLHEIGSGSYGKVWLGLYKSALVGVKQLKASNPKLLDLFLAEAAIHQSLPAHPNICKMHGLSLDQASQTYSIIVEYAPSGSIADVAESTSEYSDRLAEVKYETFKAIYGIVCGMEAVAKVDVIHRDLAARNILLDEKYFPKISDFGGSRTVSDAHSGASTASTFGPIRWMAPENFGRFYSEKSDVWSFGCTIIEIVTQEVPYQAFDGDLADLAVAIRDDGLNPLVDLVDWLEDNNVKLPRWLRDALEPCFEHDPEKRPSFSDLAQILQKSNPEFYLKYESELESFVETPLNVSPAALVATAAAFRRGTSFKTTDLSDSLGFGDSSSSSSDSEDNNIHRRSIARAISKDLAFTPRLPDVSKARVLTELGHGSFGTVYLGKFQGKFVAIKQIQSVANSAALIKEAGFMMAIKPHRNVISLLGVRTGKSSAGSQSVELVMEYATRGSLLAYIKRECDPSRGIKLLEPLIYRFALGIARGMQSVAADRVVHRDLAARNILLNSALEPLISDFGFARQLAQDQNSGETATTFGPVRWMAPEALGQRPQFSEKSDVWSYGVLLLEMITAETPYAALEMIDVIKRVKNGELDPLNFYKDELTDLNPPDFVVELAKKTFELSPAARPSFREIVSWLELNAPVEVRKAEARRLKRQEKREAVMKAIDEIMV
jgi:serine/threonine protein kinase